MKEAMVTLTNATIKHVLLSLVVKVVVVKFLLMILCVLAR